MGKKCGQGNGQGRGNGCGQGQGHRLVLMGKSKIIPKHLGKGVGEISLVNYLLVVYDYI